MIPVTAVAVVPLMAAVFAVLGPRRLGHGVADVRVV